MNKHLFIKIAALALVLGAAGVFAVAPKGSSPYISALETVTVRTAHAEPCGAKCNAPSETTCQDGPANKRCVPFGGGCNTATCIE